MSHFFLWTCVFISLSLAFAFDKKDQVNLHQKLSTLYLEHSETLQKTLVQLVPDLLAVKDSEHLPSCYNRSLSSRRLERVSESRGIVEVDIFRDSLKTVVKSFYEHNIDYFDEQEKSGEKHILKRRLDVLLDNLVRLAGHVRQCVQNREKVDPSKNEDEQGQGIVLGLTSMIFYSEDEYRRSILNHHLEDSLTENQSNITEPDLFRTSQSHLCNPSLGPDEQLPSAFSWQDQEGILSPVVDQGRCSSCYVFATTEALEAQYRIKNRHLTKDTSNNLLRLSVQATLDCVEHGCEGGTLEKPFKHFKKWGVPKLSASLYRGKSDQESCKRFKAAVRSKVTCSDDGEKSVESVQRLLWKRGPVAVSFNAQTASEGGKGTNSFDLFRFFKGTVWREDCSEGPVNHALLLVGWTASREWVLKNSWSENWGDDGYFRLPMDDRPNCGITRMMGLPLLSRE